MAYSEELLQYCLEQLSDLEALTHKKMFGGIGFFKEGKMFAGIIYGKFCLKVNDEIKSEFEHYGMEQPFPKDAKKGKGMPYYEVPPSILEDKDKMTAWAMRSWEIAMNKK
ncbi:MAG: TfoX/Sxy family protein [Bacteroidota bacterium]